MAATTSNAGIASINSLVGLLTAGTGQGGVVTTRSAPITVEEMLGTKTTGTSKTLAEMLSTQRTTGVTDTSQLQTTDMSTGLDITPEGVSAIIRQAMAGATGLASVLSGEKVAGLYDTSTKTQLAGDFMSKVISDVAAKTAKTVTKGTVGTTGQARTTQDVTTQSSTTTTGTTTQDVTGSNKKSQSGGEQVVTSDMKPAYDPKKVATGLGVLGAGQYIVNNAGQIVDSVGKVVNWIDNLGRDPSWTIDGAGNIVSGTGSIVASEPWPLDLTNDVTGITNLDDIANFAPDLEGLDIPGIIDMPSVFF